MLCSVGVLSSLPALTTLLPVLWLHAACFPLVPLSLLRFGYILWVLCTVYFCRSCALLFAVGSPVPLPLPALWLHAVGSPLCPFALVGWVSFFFAFILQTIWISRPLLFFLRGADLASFAVNDMMFLITGQWSVLQLLAVGLLVGRYGKCLLLPCRSILRLVAVLSYVFNW